MRKLLINLGTVSLFDSAGGIIYLQNNRLTIDVGTSLKQLIAKSSKIIQDIYRT